MNAVLQQGCHAVFNSHFTKIVNQAPLYDLHLHGPVANEQFIKPDPASVTDVITVFAAFGVVQHKVVCIRNIKTFVIIFTIEIPDMIKFDIIWVVWFLAIRAEHTGKALGQNTQKSIGKVKGIHAHIYESGDGFRC